MIDASAVNAIATLAKAQGEVIQIGDETLYAHGGNLTDPKHRREPTPVVLEVSTLSALVDYVQENRDDIALSTCVLHVESPGRVTLRGPLYGYNKQRDAYIAAVMRDRFEAYSGFDFGRWLDVEEMNIAIQALFEDRAARADTLRLLGTVTSEAIRTSKDNGVTQQVVASTGISLDRVIVPNPVVLHPFRTFAEVDQPGSPFVLRLRQYGPGVQGALFEADGGAWCDEAMTLVAEYLRDNTDDVAVIA